MFIKANKKKDKKDITIFLSHIFILNINFKIQFKFIILYDNRMIYEFLL